MFVKLLKHDMKSIWRFAMPLLWVALGVSLLGMGNYLLLNLVTLPMSDGWPALLRILVNGAQILLAGACSTVLSLIPVAIAIAVMVDFYSTLVADGGYLTFTLPVKTHEIIGSKALNAVLWTLIVGAAAFVGRALVETVGLVTAGSAVNWEGLFGSMFQLVGDIPRDVWGILITLIPLLAVYWLNSILLYFNAIFFGSVITKKQKVLAAIGCVFGANFLYGILMLLVFAVTVVVITTLSLVTEAVVLTIQISLIVLTAILFGITVGLFFLLKYLMEHKLNLA